MNELAGVEAWAFKIAVPVIGFLVTALVGALAWLWNKTNDNIARLHLKDEEQQRTITRLETLAEATREKDVVSREILDLTVRPITERLDALDRHMTDQTALSREQNDLMRAVLQANPGVARPRAQF